MCTYKHHVIIYIYIYIHQYIIHRYVYMFIYMYACMYICIYTHVYVRSHFGSVAILAQVGAWHQLGQVAKSVIDILTQVCAASGLAPHWHCFFMECLPTASVVTACLPCMVRVRSSTVRSRRYYQALDMGFAPPPSGAGWNRPPVCCSSIRFL